MKIIFSESNEDLIVKRGNEEVSVINDVTDIQGSLIESATVTVDNNVGTPSATVSISNNALNLAFSNLKGQKGDTGQQGPTGPQGTTSVYDQSTQSFLTTLETTPGLSQTTVMTQKATTTMLDGKEEILTNYAIAEGAYYLIFNDSTTPTNVKRSSNSANACTDFISLSELGEYDSLKLANLLTSGTSYKSGYYFDSNKAFIAGTYITDADTEILKSDMPSNAEYIRLNFVWNPATFPVVSVIHRGNKRLDFIENKVNEGNNTTLTVNSFESGKYIKSADGQTTTISTLKVTSYIPLQGATAVYSSESFLGDILRNYSTLTSSVASIAFYDENKTYLYQAATYNGTTYNAYAAHNKYMECPPNAAYIRCTVPSTVENTVITLYNTTKPIDEIQASITSLQTQLNDAISTGLTGKTVAFIGDSITQASGITNPYHKVFADLAGCTNVNLGVNATNIANNPSNNMGSQRFITRATSANLSSADMVVVFGGTNDFSYDTKAIGNLFVESSITASGRIGNKKKIPPTDTDTFAGALHELILQIRSIIGEKPIVFMTPLNRGRYNEGRPISSECNINGDYLIDFVNAIKEIGRFYGIPVFDAGGVMNFDPTERSSSSLSGDLLHPNDAGHLRLGKLLYKWVCQNIAI